ADYARSENLRDAWMFLTRNVADPARWVGDSSRFVYRKTVAGGFSFTMVDARTQEKKPAFDHDRLAAGLSKASGTAFTGLRLPFTEVDFARDGSYIFFRMQESRWICRLSDYACNKVPARSGQPRGFGVVRDLSVSPDNSPKRSPDGRWEAYVNNFNVVMRP